MNNGDVKKEADAAPPAAVTAVNTPIPASLCVNALELAGKHGNMDATVPAADPTEPPNIHFLFNGVVNGGAEATPADALKPPPLRAKAVELSIKEWD